MASRRTAVWAPAWTELFQRVDWQSDWEPEEPIAIAFLEDPQGCLRDPRVREYLSVRKGHLHSHEQVQLALQKILDFQVVPLHVRKDLAYLLLAARIASAKTMGGIDYSNPKGLGGSRRSGKRLDRIRVHNKSRTEELPLWLRPHKSLVIDSKRLRNRTVWAIASYLQTKLSVGPEVAVRMSVMALNLVGLGVPNASVKLRKNASQRPTTLLGVLCPTHVAIMRAGVSALRIESIARQLLGLAGWDFNRAIQINQSELEALSQQIGSLQESNKVMKSLELEHQSRSTPGFKSLLKGLIEERHYVDGLVDQYRRYRRGLPPEKA